MNPHPTTIALDIAALFGLVCASIVVLWAILGAWHWWTYRRFFKREDAAGKRVLARISRQTLPRP